MLHPSDGRKKKKKKKKNFQASAQKFSFVILFFIIFPSKNFEREQKLQKFEQARPDFFF